MRTPPLVRTGTGALRARHTLRCAHCSSLDWSRMRIRVRSSSIAPSRSRSFNTRCTTSRTEPTMDAISWCVIRAQASGACSTMCSCCPIQPRSSRATRVVTSRSAKSSTTLPSVRWRDDRSFSAALATWGWRSMSPVMFAFGMNPTVVEPTATAPSEFGPPSNTAMSLKVAPRAEDAEHVFASFGGPPDQANLSLDDKIKALARLALD